MDPQIPVHGVEPINFSRIDVLVRDGPSEPDDFTRLKDGLVQFHVQNQEFNCGMINIIMALSDIGPDNGPTMVIPGSHKSNFRNPDFDPEKIKARNKAADNATGAIEVHLKAGDALLFVDALNHGAKRTISGERRTVIYRYGPSWGFFRDGYRPSKELLTRLTPERRKIVWPHDKIENSPY